jgi:chromosomal replication initiation ATPase DnaA|tara:strand:- start:86 stop:457 length:372 start_codon:yes stop_codon:yes gene_type:complete
MNTKDTLVNYALEVSCKIYKAKKDNVTSNNNRKSATIKAKRMFMYYLYFYLEVNHIQMKKYFKTLNHATSIHHVKKFQFELENYNDVKKQYNKFLTKMRQYSVYGSGFYEKRKQIKELIKELK